MKTIIRHANDNYNRTDLFMLRLERLKSRLRNKIAANVLQERDSAKDLVSSRRRQRAEHR